MKKISIIACFFIILAIWACSRDMAEPEDSNCNEVVTYEDDIRLIINNNCAYSGCHDGTGAAPGNYTFYSGLRSTFENSDEFVNRVISLKDMPPDYATGPIALSVDEFNLVTCWTETGFLEN